MHGSIDLSGKYEFIFGNLNNKFEDDHIVFENDDFLIHTDGVFLNKEDWYEESLYDSMASCIISLWNKLGHRIVRLIKGSYNILIWDKKQQLLFLSNDWLSKRDMYYSIINDTLHYSAKYLVLLSSLKEKKTPIRINSNAFENMNMNGSVQTNETFIREIHFLGPFQYLLVDCKKNDISVCEIEPDKGTFKGSMSECCEHFNHLYAEAVLSQFTRNQKDNYIQLMSISGGMDSRSCLMKAYDLDFKKMTCFSYSQSGSIDSNVALSVAVDHNYEYLYYPMDNAVFTQYYYNAMMNNECQQSGIGVTGAIACAMSINLHNAGIIHTGLMGGELMGDTITYSGGNLEYFLCRIGLLSWSNSKCMRHLDEIKYNLRASNNFTRMFNNQCEVLSPFLDEDVFDFLLKVPSKYLIRRDFYRSWMKQYIPNKYKTTYFHGTIYINPITEYLVKAKCRISKKIRGLSENEMNPVEYWLDKNISVQKAFSDAFMEGIECIRRNDISGEYEYVLDCITKAWNTGNWVHKLYSFTSLEALRIIAKE